jgi:hypothetical protein
VVVVPLLPLFLLNLWTCRNGSVVVPLLLLPFKLSSLWQGREAGQLTEDAVQPLALFWLLVVVTEFALYFFAPSQLSPPSTYHMINVDFVVDFRFVTKSHDRRSFLPPSSLPQCGLVIVDIII